MEQSQLKDAIKTFLNEHRKAVVGIVGEQSIPTTSLMLYVIDDDFNAYFGTRKAFGKYKALTAHPHISLTVVQEKIDPLQAVEIRGTIEFIPEEETEKTLEFFESKNPAEYYVKGAEDFVMCKVTPDFIRWMDATSGDLVLDHVEL